MLIILDVDNTRFPPLRVSCSPGTGAGASSPRHETHRNVAKSRYFRSAKGLRRHTSSVLYAPSALSAMALSYESPTVSVDGSIPYSITLVVYTVPVYCVPWSLWWIRPSAPPVLLQCLFDRFGSVFPQCGLMVFPGVVIVSR